MKLTKLTTVAQRLNLPFIVCSLGITIILLWVGSFKFSIVSAEGIKGFIENSPLISWMYKIFSVATTAKIIGSTEITAAICILLGNFYPKVGIIGSLLTVFIFLVTSTFVLSTPGTVQLINGIYQLSETGLLLFKDISILGAALYLFTYFGYKAVQAENSENLKNRTNN